MRLVEVCEPLFQYICALNRSARKGGGIFDMAQVRAEIKQILDKSEYTASSDHALLERYKQIQLPLLFFIDSMIKRSQLAFAQDWENLAYERRELAGEDRFFEMLDSCLRDKSEASTDKLAVYYTCIGLGFTGWHTGQPDVLRKKMLEISARVKPLFEPNPEAYICPEAYKSVNTTNLIQPPSASLVGIAIAVIGLTFVMLVAYFYLYLDGSSKLKGVLQSIIDQGKAASHTSLVENSK